MGSLRSAAVVSSQWLKRQLKDSPKQLRLLDTSWSALNPGKNDYLSKHIPGALFLDLNQCVRSRPTLARNLPEADCFSQYIKSLGVNRESHLVVYDRGNMVSSARAWWTLRAFGHPSVSVLDGGLKGWIHEGFNVTEGEEATSHQKGDFEVDIQRHLIAEFEDMIKYGEERSVQVVDARSPEHFRGEEPEPTKNTTDALEGMKQPIPSHMLAGHIPGALNMRTGPLINNVQIGDDQFIKLLQDKDTLRKAFDDHGIDLSKPMVTMCYNGNAACILALGAHLLGKEDVKVYYGSYTEYGQRARPENLVMNKPSRSKG